MSKQASGCGSCMMMCLLIGGCGVMLSQCSVLDFDSPSAPEAPRAPDKLDAWVMAQMFVEKELKAPKSASYGSAWNGDYQSPDKVVTDHGDGKFTVNAWVDSQNSFGATIRTHFTCELQHQGGDRWRCTGLQFAE